MNNTNPNSIRFDDILDGHNVGNDRWKLRRYAVALTHDTQKNNKPAQVLRD